MPDFARSWSLALLVLLMTGLAGCSTLSSSSDDDASDATAAADSTLSPDVTPVDPAVKRLYALEARILAAPDSAHRAPLLDQAMAELSGLLSDHPDAIERDAVREVYRGLTAEYRRFHNYTDPSADSMETARGDIFTTRARLFAQLETVDEPLLEDVMAPRDAEVQETQVPLTMNRLVKQSMTYLQREPDKHLNGWLQRAETYFPMIEHILADEGVPDELKYLAMIESGLNPRARSWAGAGGMWQFMAATGRLYGLRVDTWVDERRDPEKATRAAAQHLNDLYENFNDWHLVLAAYNCGGGCVRRAMRRARRAGASNPDYWDAYRYLPRETRGYVPMFIAAARIASDPEAFDIKPPAPAPAYAYDYVAVHGSMMSLREVADLAGTETDVIRALNPELRRASLPPSRSPYSLRIPLGTYPQFALNYADLPDSKKRPATTYRVRSGDTLSEIAQKFGTSTRALQRTNSIRGSIINVGQPLAVPVRSYDPALPSSGSEQPLRVHYDMDEPVRPLEPIVITDAGERARPSEQAATEEAPPVRTARLDERDADRASSNSSSSTSSSSKESTASRAESTASPNTSSPAARESRAASSSSANAATPGTGEGRSEPTRSASTRSETTSASSTKATTYRVRRGDTLSEIAARHGLRTSELRRWNQLGGSRIDVGQLLRLTKPEEVPSTATYTVRRGDTLEQIGRRFGVSISELRSWNGINGSRILPGQTLTIHHDGSLPTFHVVQRGDTLGGIAQSYGISITRLRAWNNLRGSRIYPGQKLRVSAN